MEPEARGIPFITFSEKQGFVLSKEAEDFLHSLNDCKLGLISVVGKYRTGKSFFVNRVLLQRINEGFAVGPTINPCTKGLWLWTKTLESENPEHEGLKVLLIDTEGFGGIDENVNHDSRIFLFSLLLSSFFIYNSVGNIDEQALNSLSLIINLAKDIQIKSHSSDSEKEDPANYFPSFLWIVRDFALKMVDSNGVAITPKDYLEKALELQKGVSDAIESKNRIRRLFKHFFKDRDCVTMVRPIENEKDLQKMNSMDDGQLREEFIDQIKQARKKIFKKIRPKSINGKCLNGEMLIELCKAYIQAMNTGHMPNIENAWTYLCKNESHKALNEALDELERMVGQIISNKQCLTNVQVKEKKQEMNDNVLKIFKKKALGSEEEIKDYIDRLSSKIKDRLKEIKEINGSNWMNFYESLVQSKKSDFEFKILNDHYSDYYTFQQDLNLFREAFEKEAPSSHHKSTFIAELLLKLQKMGSEAILKAKELEQTKLVRTLEQKLLMSENDLKSKRRDLEDERNSFVSKLNVLEREKAMIKANESTLSDRLREMKSELDCQVRKGQEVTEGMREGMARQEKEFMERFKAQEEKFNNLRVSSQQTVNELEKQNALLSQEMGFSKREIGNLQGKIESLDAENRRLKLESAAQAGNLEKTKQKINEVENIKNQEIGFLKSDAEKRLKEMGTELERSKEIVKRNNELQVEKTYLESQVNFFKSQLDENKRLHDALLMALQQGINNNDNENTNELVETNRYLSAAMEKMEIRCKILEEKAEKLKNFKKMVKNSSTMQCLHCSKHVPNAIFLQHVESCLNDLQNPSQSSTKLGSQGSKNSQSSIPSPGDLIISINQTMVKESADNKPYTEYLIQVTYNGNKWTVARKYKNFCELHQGLFALFPSMKFPESVATVMNSGTDVNNIFNSKRPTVIEERRKALQQFLRDLGKIECVRSCKLFKNFLDIEKGEQNAFNNENILTIENHIKSKGIIATITSLNSQRELKTTGDEKKSMISKPSFATNLMLPDELPGKEINLKIDKKMLPPSPSSFLNSWNNDRMMISHVMGLNNKENKNPRSKSVSDNKTLGLPPPELINNPAQTMVNDEENDTDRIANIDVSNISSTLQADTQSFQEISNEKSILSLLKGENQQAMMMTSKNATNPFNNHNEKFLPKSKNPNNLDLYHSNHRPQSYYSKNIYAHNKELSLNQPNNSSYSSNYEKKKNDKGNRQQTLATEKYKNIKLDSQEFSKVRPQDRFSQLIPSSKTWETMTGRINDFTTSNGYK